MFNRRRLLLAVAGACLLLASGAAAAEPNAFTATSTPSHVKPATSASYTIKLTNKPSSPKEADKAKIGIPTDFVVDEATVQASAGAVGDCLASTWVADGVLVTGGKINVTRPGGPNNWLCPGATLTVVFSATSASAEGEHTWTTELLRGEETFALNGLPPTVVVDGTAPDTTITSPAPPTPTNQTSASFSFSSTEPESTFQCRRDGAAFTACTSPKSYTGLGPGAHTFEVRATDLAGNTDSSSASNSWTIDLTAPNTSVDSGPPAATNQTSASFSFSSNELGSTFQCSLDGAAFTDCPSPQAYSGLAEGPHTFAVRAIDPARNTDAVPASHSWTIDLTGAATRILFAPPSSTNLTNASFIFESSEPEAGTTFECSLDGALFTACSPPIAYSNLADGSHTFAVRAVDQAKNTGPAAPHTWTIDSRPPTATVASGPAALGNTRSATFAFSANEPSSFQCSLDGGSFAPCNSPASYQNLGDGAHTFIARPTDAVGNTGASSSYSWTIDATAPETSLSSGPRSGTTTLSATFTFSASEPAAFQCKLDAAAFAPCGSPRSYSGLTRIGHSFEVRAIDAAGNPDSTPAVHRWTIAAAPRRVRTISALLAPRAGARVTSPPRLVWRRLAGASYYNVQLYRGRVKVLSSWPTRTSLQLRARWTYLGRQRQLAPGAYRWYVWPGYGRASARRYGRLLGQSTFTVTAPARR